MFRQGLIRRSVGLEQKQLVYLFRILLRDGLFSCLSITLTFKIIYLRSSRKGHVPNTFTLLLQVSSVCCIGGRGQGQKGAKGSMLGSGTLPGLVREEQWK